MKNEHTQPLLTLKEISIRFKETSVLENVNMELTKGTILSVLGKSGSGKTTLLKILAGLQNGYSGSVHLSGKPIDQLSPRKRGIVYLYQEPLLFPHLTVWDNIAFGLRIRKFDENHIKQETKKMVSELQLGGHQQKLPKQLSGGQKQRVAFGRALIIRPKVMLLDEPFGSLDPDTRSDMQALFKRISGQYSITALFVTHDVKEALIVGDEFGIIEQGVLNRFPSRKEFITDKRSGITNELAFWNQLAADEDSQIKDKMDVIKP
jgi:putrescine transport system ATP-binding protein